MGQPDRDASILLIETDAVAGLDLADALEAAGYRVTGPFRTAAEAETCLADRKPALAVLDLGTADGARLARTLRRRGVPFLVCTERAEAAGSSVALADPFGTAGMAAFMAAFMAEFTDVPSLSKPAWHRDVVLTMGELAARAGGTG